MVQISVIKLPVTIRELGHRNGLKMGMDRRVGGWGWENISTRVIPVLTVFRQEQILTHFELDMFYMSVSRAFARQ